MKYLGVGGVDTWHGTTELRVKGCTIISTDEPLLDEGEEQYSDDEESIQAPSAATESSEPLPKSGSNVSFEGKLKIDFRKQVSQLVATSRLPKIISIAKTE